MFIYFSTYKAGNGSPNIVVIDPSIYNKDNNKFKLLCTCVGFKRLATLRYEPFQYNTKCRYGTGIYKRSKDVTVHNNRFGTIQEWYWIITKQCSKNYKSFFLQPQLLLQIILLNNKLHQLSKKNQHSKKQSWKFWKMFKKIEKKNRFSVATLFRFVARFGCVRIKDSSRKRFALNGIQRIACFIVFSP